MSHADSFDEWIDCITEECDEAKCSITNLLSKQAVLIISDIYKAIEKSIKGERFILREFEDSRMSRATSSFAKLLKLLQGKSLGKSVDSSGMSIFLSIHNKLRLLLNGAGLL